jgi:hypothetical protein
VEKAQETDGSWRCVLLGETPGLGDIAAVETCLSGLTLLPVDKLPSTPLSIQWGPTEEHWGTAKQPPGASKKLQMKGRYPAARDTCSIVHPHLRVLMATELRLKPILKASHEESGRAMFEDSLYYGP